MPYKKIFILLYYFLLPTLLCLFCVSLFPLMPHPLLPFFFALSIEYFKNHNNQPKYAKKESNVLCYIFLKNTLKYKK